MAATAAKKSSSAPAGMPIANYDGLSIKEIVPHLVHLTGAELKAVKAHEKAGKNRVTLLRAVRKVELDREAGVQATKAAARATSRATSRAKAKAAAKPAPIPAPAPASHLTVVEDDDDDDDIDSFDSFESSGSHDSLDSLDSHDSLDSLDSLDWSDDSDWDVPEEEAVVEAVSIDDVDDASYAAYAPAEPVVEVVTEVVVPKTSGSSRKSRSGRAPVKGVTWEEEIRPELPKRYDMSYDPEPPIVALVPPEMPELERTPMVAPPKTPKAGAKAAKAPKAPKATAQPVLTTTPKAGAQDFSSKPKAILRFENVALAMAAVLAILLGLAIGTVLARSGGSDTPTPASAASPAAVVQYVG